MKKCPACAEEIQADAVKCRYCGEWLEEHEQDAASESQPTEVAPPPEIPAWKDGRTFVSWAEYATEWTKLNKNHRTEAWTGLDDSQRESLRAAWRSLGYPVESLVADHPARKCGNCGSTTLTRTEQRPQAGAGCIIALIGLVLAPVLLGIPIILYGLHLRGKVEMQDVCNSCGARLPVVVQRGMTGGQRRVLLVLGAAMLAIWAFVFYMTTREETNPRPSSERSTRATAEIGESFEATAIVRATDPAAADVDINAWEVPFGGGATGRGMVLHSFAQGTAVAVIRRAWHEDEERFYYYVVDGSRGGWVPETFVQLQQNP